MTVSWICGVADLGSETASDTLDTRRWQV